jgi:hypothetical protein
MELAICLSKYAAESDALKYFEEFVDGFCEHGIAIIIIIIIIIMIIIIILLLLLSGKLTRKEVEAIPDLINLRVLSNVVYFVGRAIAGIIITIIIIIIIIIIITL